MNYDLVVIGAGAGGRQAALAAREHGLRVMLAEAGFVGGACVNSGCIPTKFLLGSTAAGHLFEAQKKARCAKGEIGFNLATIQERKDRYVKALRNAVEKRLAEAGVELVAGRAAFTGPKSLSVKTGDGAKLEASFKHCVVATGSTPASFPGLKPDGANVLSSSGLLGLREVPESLVIVGGGVIGLELGGFFSRFGTKITMVEVMERIALSEDAEVSAALHRQLTREGWKIHTGRKIKEVTSEGENAVLRFEDGEELIAAKAMIAVGRRPGGMGLNPEAAGIKTTGTGWIETDDFLLAAPGIYAVGDANKRTLLAHAAEHQADYAVRHIMGLEKEPYDSTPMPSCIYGNNEAMHVGPHTEELLRTHKPLGATVAVSYCQLVSNPIAQSLGQTQGWIKVTWVNDAVHSVAAWGHGVSHLLATATIIVAQRWDSNRIIFAHPTLEESLKSALLAKREIL